MQVSSLNFMQELGEISIWYHLIITVVCFWNMSRQQWHLFHCKWQTVSYEFLDGKKLIIVKYVPGKGRKLFGQVMANYEIEISGNPNIEVFYLLINIKVAWSQMHKGNVDNIVMVNLCDGFLNIHHTILYTCIVVDMIKLLLSRDMYD